MGLETGTYISDLIATNPVGATDDRATADDHLRLIKAVLKNTFPTSGIYPAFPAGTVMLFMQAAAPVGWTQVVSHNDKALRIVNGAGAGSGGAEAFTTIFNSGTTKATNQTTLSTNQIPAHTHPVNIVSGGGGNHTHTTAINRYTNTGTSGSMGFGGGTNGIFSATEYYASSAPGNHTHNVNGNTGNNTTTGSGHSHTLTLNLQYVDIIACSKD